MLRDCQLWVCVADAAVLCCCILLLTCVSTQTGIPGSKDRSALLNNGTL